MTTALTFNRTTLVPVPVTGSPFTWLRSTEIARALGYSDERSVSRIYSRNAEEFSENMTQIIEISEGVNLTTTARIFSLRGCHLLAMFARTPVAKAFRRWVLDVLDKLAEEERARVCEAVKATRGRRALGGNLPSIPARKRIPGPVEAELAALGDELHELVRMRTAFNNIMGRIHHASSPLYMATYGALGWHERCGVSADLLAGCISASYWNSLEMMRDALDSASHYVRQQKVLARLHGM